MPVVTPAPAVVAAPLALSRAGDLSHPDRDVRVGQRVRVARGVYADADAYRALPPWSRYLARVHAVALAWPDSVFTLESAAALLGLPVFGEPRDVHVLVRSPAKARALHGIRVHSSTVMPHVVSDGPLTFVSAGDTTVDICRTRHPAVGLAVACAALRADASLSVDDLVARSAERPSGRGRRAAEWMFARATATPESTLEATSLAVIEWLGFPPPELQQWFGAAGEANDRVDFWWPRVRVAGEADGEVKYSGALGDARAALRARNARDARLMARGVSATAHWGWSDLLAPAQLRAILRAAGVTQTGPEHSEPLRTLPAALRSATPRPLPPRASQR